MPFTSDLVVEERLKRPGWWQLVEDLVYKGRDDTFTVPAGFHDRLRVCAAAVSLAGATIRKVHEGGRPS